MTQPTILDPPTTTDTPTVWPPPAWAPPTAPAPPAKRKTGRYVWAAIGMFILGAAVVSAATGSKNAATVPYTTVPTAETSSSGRAAVNAWAGRYGADDASTLGDDMTALMAVASAGDVAGMGTSCRTFQRHLTTATSHLPTPDAQLTSALTSAYGYFSQAATACINGIATTDSDELSKMLTYLPLGTDSLRVATTRLNAFD